MLKLIQPIAMFILTYVGVPLVNRLKAKDSYATLKHYTFTKYCCAFGQIRYIVSMFIIVVLCSELCVSREEDCVRRCISRPV